MKLAAIKGKIGDTVFYSSKMTFHEVSKLVKAIDNELHESKTLNEMIQRGITDNVNNIVDYLKNQPDRFFNSLVLAVYDKSPQWIEVEMDFPSEHNITYRDLGFLEFSGKEKIFPVDGQHRTEAIKKLLKSNPEFKNESVGVIFIAHSVQPDGKEKTRRIFSTLNRYAKPVSPKDIIALDEDDITAIATRKMLIEHKFFSVNKVICTPLSKSIPNNDKKAFTSIIALHECNTVLLHCFLTNNGIKTPVKNFTRIRPPEENINDYYKFIISVWDTILKYPDMKKYQRDYNALRDNGGSLLFRPIGLIPFINACKTIHNKTKIDLVEILKKFHNFDFDVNSDLWNDILWSDIKNTMIMANKTLTKNIFIYIYDKSILSVNDQKTLFKDLLAAKNIKKPEDFLKKFTLKK